MKLDRITPFFRIFFDAVKSRNRLEILDETGKARQTEYFSCKGSSSFLLEFLSKGTMSSDKVSRKATFFEFIINGFTMHFV